MSEVDTIDWNSAPLTVTSLSKQFADCGLAAGQTVLVHTAMSKLGWIVGGQQAVIEALLSVLGPTGTLMMPAHASENSEPSHWRDPPVPEHWWQTIRDEHPAYDPRITPTRYVGCVAELFRTWPGTLRSNHPIGSMAALGPNAAYLTSGHILAGECNDESPVGRLNALDGYVFLLGVGHERNTSLHLAEERACWPGKRRVSLGSAILVNGLRKWVTYDALDLNSSDFSALGNAYEADHNIVLGRVGRADVRFLKQRPLVDYAVVWIERNRK
jgi:aminoglycoside 3-N-acetyltransferase